MMTSDNKVGGWVKKGQNHDDVILEWSLTNYRILGNSFHRKSIFFRVKYVDIFI
jgi:hypothetical protein